jgi:hypothetical protein
MVKSSRSARPPVAYVGKNVEMLQRGIEICRALFGKLAEGKRDDMLTPWMRSITSAFRTLDAKPQAPSDSTAEAETLKS